MPGLAHTRAQLAQVQTELAELRSGNGGTALTELRKERDDAIMRGDNLERALIATREALAAAEQRVQSLTEQLQAANRSSTNAKPSASSGTSTKPTKTQSNSTTRDKDSSTK